MLELQGEMENKDDTVRELMGKLMAHDSEQRNVKQEAMLQTEELTGEIKVLQEQLRMVRELILTVFIKTSVEYFTSALFSEACL